MKTHIYTCGRWWWCCWSFRSCSLYTRARLLSILMTPLSNKDSTCIRQHTSAYVIMRQHTSAYVSIRRHTSARFLSILMMPLSNKASTWYKSACFPGTKLLALLVQKYLLYWSKSTCFIGAARLYMRAHHITPH